MSTCKDCLKPFSSRQSLCNHRKRAHPVSKGGSYLVPPKLKAQEKGRMTEGQKVTDMISGREDTSPENVDVSTGVRCVRCVRSVRCVHCVHCVASDVCVSVGCVCFSVMISSS